jgi:protein TonB
MLLSIGVFMLLPIMQKISEPPEQNMEVRTVSTTSLEPPPPPPPEEQPEEEPEEQPPPEIADEAPPLDLSQLELALNPGMGGGMGGDFQVDLSASLKEKTTEANDAIFSMAELDQKPRAIYQPSPRYPSELRGREIQGTVHVIFMVSRRGRVVNPIVQKATHAAFRKPALQALKRWRFEPGKRNGKPVRFKMRVPITFMKG